MDLCLRGSQINLVTRQKPPRKFSSQSSLLHGGTPRQAARPRSASSCQRRCRSTPFLHQRPHSAEESKWQRRAGSACAHIGDYLHALADVGVVGGAAPLRCANNRAQQRRYQSVSSTNLLKLLLDEPIKRSWLCRSGNSTDNQSELSSSRRSASNSSLHRRNRCESLGSSSAEGETRAAAAGTTSQLRHWSSRGGSMSATGGRERSAAAYNNNWSASAKATLAASVKPDLPGRVSFSKGGGGGGGNLPPDLDSSDCDNDKQEAPPPGYSSSPAADEPQSISAPGPLSFQPSFQTAPSAATTSSTTVASAELPASKKSVHFGAAGSSGAEVYAETYEYPKCPSENCSCSTRSSSSASLDVLDGKCACASPSCRYALDVGGSGGGGGGGGKAYKLSATQEEEQQGTTPATPLLPIEESKVIREYKNAVAEQLENSIVKNLLLDEGGGVGAAALGAVKGKAFSALNNADLPSYLEKYSAPIKTADTLLEMQNNLSETKSATALYKTANGKRNELLSKTTNIGGGGGGGGGAGGTLASSSSESVINNYLKVTGAASTLLANKKPENNSSVLGRRRAGSAAGLRSNAVGVKSKMANAERAAAKLRAASSFGSLRDEANLNEFHLDKVDSWMSMHQEAMGAGLSGGGGGGGGSDGGSGVALTTAEAAAAYEQLKQSLHMTMAQSSSQDGAEHEAMEEEDSDSQLTSKSEDNSQDDSTYDEIVSVIKEIEEDKKQDNYAERAEMELKLHTPSPAEGERRVPRAAETPSTAATHTPEAPDKYKDILNYLDNVEDSCDKTLLETRRSMPDSNRSEVEFVVEPDIAEDVPKLADLLLLPNHQLARRVIALSLRANELANGLLMSKELVAKIRGEKQKAVRAEKTSATQRLREQKKHYEGIVQRHQTFIEQLLKDKGSLCEKVAALTRRLESQNQAWQHKLEAEVQRAKETALAGEKIRRERWVRENTKRIKELTVRGLEAEINKMTDAHSCAIDELKRTHQQQLAEALAQARHQHEQLEASVRTACAQDREAIIEKERTAIRERFERQLEEQQRAADEQRQKLCEEAAAERERQQQQLRAKDADYQQRRLAAQREKDSELEQALGELQEKMSKQEEKYQNRINTIEKQYESDFAIWKREYENGCKMSQVEKENTIRQHYRAERDRQIDAIVSRMDAEALKNSEEFEAKVSRLKEKYEKDVEAVELAEHTLRDKYAETRGKLAECDAQVRNGQAEVKQLQIELQHCQKMCADFLGERDQLRDTLRDEIQHEVATLKTERDQEIQRIHRRVQQAIEKKDATIDILQKETGGLRERCLKLEAIIRQQRKDYCVK